MARDLTFGTWVKILPSALRPQAPRVPAIAPIGRIGPIAGAHGQPVSTL